MAGYQQLVRGEPFTPKKPERLELVMPDVCHTFRPGQRIMAQI